jgi:hypothetical protein
MADTLLRVLEGRSDANIRFADLSGLASSSGSKAAIIFSRVGRDGDFESSGARIAR